jgi:hypothetical protein
MLRSIDSTVPKIARVAMIEACYLVAMSARFVSTLLTRYLPDVALRVDSLGLPISDNRKRIHRGVDAAADLDGRDDK